MATEDMTPGEDFDEGFDGIDASDEDTASDLDMDMQRLDIDRAGHTETAEPSHRLRVLLFTLDQKLQQRKWLGLKAFVMLGVLMLITVAAALATPVVAMLVMRTEPIHSTSLKYLFRAGYVAVALSPFALSIVNYFWTTYAQIFFRGLRNFEAMLASDQFSDFSEYVHVDLLTDDWSIFSLLHNVFAVDVGFSMLRFFIVAALLVFPFAIQAGVSLAVVLLIKSHGEMIDMVLAGGLTIIYFVFFVFTLIKNTSFYSSLTK